MEQEKFTEGLLKSQEDFLAIQWDGENIREIMEFLDPVDPIYLSGFANSDEIVGVPTVDGVIGIGIGGWIEKRLDGLRAYPTQKIWDRRFAELVESGEVILHDPIIEETGEEFRLRDLPYIAWQNIKEWWRG